MFANQEKLFRMNSIRASIFAACKAGLDVYEDKIISEVMRNFGTARRTALEYLKELEFEGFIIRKDGLLFTKEAWEAEQILNSKPVIPEVKVQEVKQ